MSNQTSTAANTETTRIFFGLEEFHKVCNIHDMHRTLHMECLENYEVFLMAGRVGIDCRTADLLNVATILTALKLI
jgi:hypothetical protein